MVFLAGRERRRKKLGWFSLVNVVGVVCCKVGFVVGRVCDWGEIYKICFIEKNSNDRQWLVTLTN